MEDPRSPSPPAGPRRLRRNAKLLHELQVHQAELESQNEELRRTQVDLAAVRDRFVDLYDFAPVAYFTVDAQGRVVDANLTAAALLGVERATLLREPFVRHLVPAFADAWQHHLAHVLEQQDSQHIELELQRQAGEPLHVQLDSRRMARPDAPPTLRIALTDITHRALAERSHRIADSTVQAQEAQRYRVAHELHEELGQRLSALKMDLTALSHPDRELDPTRRRGDIDTMLETLDQAVATVRRVTRELAPLMLHDLGLHAAVDWLVQETERRSGRHIELCLEDDEAALGERTSVGLYRMVQEMLEPLVHDAAVEPARLEMHQQQDEFVLAIETSGSAWPALARAGLGRGTTLQDRAHLMGARIDVQDVPGGPGRLIVRLPLPPSSQRGVDRRPAPR